MKTLLQQATEAIYAYTYGMDTGNWVYAASRFATEIDVDYSQVGASKGKMTNQELQQFLKQLLGKPDLRVHTAISQIVENPKDPAEFIAYYSVRHYKGELGKAKNFLVFGWYSYRLEDGLIRTLTINVQAMEGNPALLS